MTCRNKTNFVILGIFAWLLFFADVRAEAMSPSNNVIEGEVVSGPEQHSMRLVSFDPWVIEGEVLGVVAAYVYDDVTTERSADYWELYDKKDNLLAVSWFDKLGIQRTAIDRGIVEEKDELEGVFVVLLDGDLT